MKAAPKTPKAKRQEEQANFISWRFALLCGCILLALAFLLGRVAWLQVISPDMLVRQGDMRSLRVQEVSTARGNDYRSLRTSAGGQRAGEGYLGRPERAP
ncbi:cell division protein FtsI [Klebsiella pneumoniae]|uniref:Cell division protein FtsI n=1 Tax=Klebsiella pneumoniae TaxID=573 RepID=A0A377ZKP7_KLEPN|nr:cell division protein FtsI [Klebsiella pneumoniae]